MSSKMPITLLTILASQLLASSPSFGAEWKIKMNNIKPSRLGSPLPFRGTLTLVGKFDKGELDATGKSDYNGAFIDVSSNGHWVSVLLPQAWEPKSFSQHRRRSAKNDAYWHPDYRFKADVVVRTIHGVERHIGHSSFPSTKLATPVTVYNGSIWRFDISKEFQETEGSTEAARRVLDALKALLNMDGKEPAARKLLNENLKLDSYLTTGEPGKDSGEPGGDGTH
jgi:hypothetical protein